MGVHEKLAAISFFKITSARYRTDIIEKLFRETGRAEFMPFWNSMSLILRDLDGLRNELVHWKVVVHLSTDDRNNIVRDMRLAPPNMWSYLKDYSSGWKIEDFTAFRNKADFAISSLNLVHGHIFHALNQEQPWHDIFRQQATYPPPVGHPLYRTSTTQSLPPPSVLGKP
jgi:hypothetical protein